MSDTAVVLFIGLVGFAAGFYAAVRFFPFPAPARSAELVAWVSRLVAAAALSAFALDIYAAVKFQSGDDAPTDPVSLADGLVRALFDAGVLFALAVGLAVVGGLLLADDRRAPGAE